MPGVQGVLKTEKFATEISCNEKEKRLRKLICPVILAICVDHGKSYVFTSLYLKVFQPCKSCEKGKMNLKKKYFY